jgi:deoxyadenosine/deoxycytidine kinase
MVNTILILGAVGSGKTTAAQVLASRLDGAVLVPEPVDDNPFLPDYARDRARWALACQTHYYLQYMHVYQATMAQHPDAQSVVIDAGAATNTQVYGRYMQEQALVTPAEFQLYRTLTAIIRAQYAYPDPALIVSVEAPLETCFARLRARGRAFEVVGHSREYVAAIHRYTSEMVAAYARAGVSVIHLDTALHDVRTAEGSAWLLAAVRSGLGG